jgi:hypothetical protein
MKKLSTIIFGMFLFVFSMGLQAQTKTGFEYFKGKWNVVAKGPNGGIKMIIEFVKTDNKIIGTISDTDGKELYKVTNTEIKVKQATVTFIGSQGSDVPLELNQKDENHVVGSIMDMFGADGERIKEVEK